MIMNGLVMKNIKQFTKNYENNNNNNNNNKSGCIYINNYINKKIVFIIMEKIYSYKQS